MNMYKDMNKGGYFKKAVLTTFIWSEIYSSKQSSKERKKGVGSFK